MIKFTIHKFDRVLIYNTKNTYLARRKTNFKKRYPNEKKKPLIHNKMDESNKQT